MKAYYMANCINYNTIFDDVTEMAQAVEHSQEINRAKFYLFVSVLKEHKKIKKIDYRRNNNLFILYDITKDIHYFYLR